MLIKSTLNIGLNIIEVIKQNLSIVYTEFKCMLRLQKTATIKTS